MSAIVLCSSRRSVASATLTIVVSRIDMIEPTMTTALMRQTYASMRSSAETVTTVQVACITSGREPLLGRRGEGVRRLDEAVDGARAQHLPLALEERARVVAQHEVDLLLRDAAPEQVGDNVLDDVQVVPVRRDLL